MADCHVETHIERPKRKKRGLWRASVIHTASGRQLYETWPYAVEGSAIERARQWIREEYRRNETPLFSNDETEEIE